MKRKFLAAFLAMAALGAQAATLDTTWQYTPYSNEVTDLKVFRPGANPIVWIGTHHGVVRIKGTDTLRLNTANSKLPGDRISPVGYEMADHEDVNTVTALDSSGNYWIAYRDVNKLVSIDTAGGIASIDSSIITPWNSIVAIAATKSAIYIANGNNNIYSGSKTGSWRYATTTINGYFTSLGVGPGDSVWAGIRTAKNEDTMSSKLLNISRPSTSALDFTYKDTANGNVSTKIFKSDVYSICFSPDTSNGKNMLLRTTKIDPGAAKYGYTNLSEDSLKVFQNDTLVKDSGFLKLNGSTGQISFFSTASSPYLIKNDSLYCININGGYKTEPGIYKQAISSKTGLSSLTSIADYSDNKLLVGSSAADGLYLWPIGHTYTKVSYEISRTGNFTNATSGAAGALYVASDSAVYSRSNKDTVLNKVYASTEGTIRSLDLDADGSLWIGKSNGLVQWKNGTPTTIQKNFGSDSVVAIAHGSGLTAFLHNSSAGIVSLHTLSGSTWASVSLTGLGSDSTKISALRVSNQGVIWAVTSSSAYSYAGSSWSKWGGVALTTGSIGDLDVASNNVWVTASTSNIRGFLASASVTGNKKIDSSALALSITSLKVLAESDTSAWTTFGNSLKHYSHSAAAFDASYLGTTTNNGFHSGTRLAGRALLSDSANGLWIVMQDGISRMKVTTSTPTIGISGHASSLTSPLASLRAGKLELSLSSAATVRIQVLDLNGRVLERQDLGTLTAGSHTVSLAKGQGLRLVRIQAGKQSQTLRLPSF